MDAAGWIVAGYAAVVSTASLAWQVWSWADVPYVIAQAGHTDPKMTLGLYAQVIASKTDHGVALDGLVELDATYPMAASHGRQ